MKYTEITSSGALKFSKIVKGEESPKHTSSIVSHNKFNTASQNGVNSDPLWTNFLRTLSQKGAVIV